MAETIREVAVPVPSGAALRKDNPMSTGSQFVPLNGIKAGVAASRRDLEKIRAIGQEVRTKEAALSNRSQYTPGFIATETAKLRQMASEDAQNYLVKEQSFKRLETLAKQRDHWTTPQYLGRQSASEDLALEKFDEGGNQTKLLKALLSSQRLNNTLLSVRMMDTDSLAALGDAAVEAGDWSRLSIVTNALAGRAEGGNEVARRARQRLEGVTIPDCQEAVELLEESRKIAEWLDVGLRSISSGNEDSSLRVQSYIEMQNQRTAQQQEQQRMEADAAALSDLRRRTG